MSKKIGLNDLNYKFFAPEPVYRLALRIVHDLETNKDKNMIGNMKNELVNLEESFTEIEKVLEQKQKTFNKETIFR